MLIIGKEEMLLSAALPPQVAFPTTLLNYNPTPLVPVNCTKYQGCACRATAAQRALYVAATASTSLRQVSYSSDGDGVSNSQDEDDENSMVPSAAAVAAMIRAASTSPVDFSQRIEKSGAGSGSKNKPLVLPSQDFLRLCLEQLHLFRRIVDPDALLSVYVRPADSYVMDRLELRRITLYPGVHVADIVVLVSNFSVPAGLRVAEAAISNQQAEFFPEIGAVVFPMVTHPFIVGFFVAEFPKMSPDEEWHGIKEDPYPGKSLSLFHGMDPPPLQVQTLKDQSTGMPKFSVEQNLNAVNITRSLTMAYVMDQKAMLLQQSAWQNNVRMSNLVEQIWGSLSSIQTLTKMLSVHLKRSEISYDIVEDIIVQGDHMRNTLQQLQDAVYLTKANILRYNNETLKDIQQSSGTLPGVSFQSSIDRMQEPAGQLSISSTTKDSEFPMPPLALAPSFHQEIRPCEISILLQDLVRAIKPLAHQQQRVVELCDLSSSLQVAIQEPDLRQALSNLIEGALLRTRTGGRIDIVSTGAPAGGALVIIDDDGPDMHYMTQMHALTPFGPDLYGEDRVEDNMTWNFIAGLSVAREILESYGCVVRIISPRRADAGGTRVEIWLPSVSSTTSADAGAGGEMV